MKSVIMLVLAISIVASSEEGIKFSLPLPEAKPVKPATQPVAVIPPKPAVTPIALTTKEAPTAKAMDLDRLTAKDSESYDVYSTRIALIDDSITNTNRTIDSLKVKANAILTSIKGHDDMSNIMLVCSGSIAGLGVNTFAF